ncbi:hypothetical protein J3R83DRAFT_2480 [Lanmaoa asiatica]|nr:hypothetical protein J3R83DRAFT_2480 [Lanmaoa asiatica]
MSRQIVNTLRHFPLRILRPPPSEHALRYDHSSSRYSVDDILQIVLKSRKSWKTLKGRSEAVWPPHLEATMLKALQEYEPNDSRETRMLGRYPMRNRFISDYIHRVTGKYRSAKQVGSRLQQLRDTPEGRELIDTLTRCYRTRMDAGTCNARVPVYQPIPWNPSSSPSVSTISCDSSSTSSSSASPVTPTIPLMPRLLQPKTRQPAEPRMPVYIYILPQQSHLSSMCPDPSSASATSTSGFDSRPSDAARHIRNIDPTVTFVSPSPVKGKSSYIVLLDGAPVHSEDTTLEYVGPYLSSPTGRSPGEQPILYNTPLVPKYWDVLCEAADPTLYTIVQDVYRVPDPAPTQDYSQRPRPVRIFSAIYHFQYSSADSTPSTNSTSVDPSSSGSSMTSAFDAQALQGSMPVHLTQATSFPTSSTYTSPETEQNLFDEPFILDVNFDQISFDDFVVNMDNTSDSASSHFFARDPNTFVRFDPPPFFSLLGVECS